MSDNTLDKAANVLAQARAYLKNKAPYIASTVYGLVPYFYRGMMAQEMGPIGVTKGMVMLVDPDWAATLSPEMMAACIYHECMHILRGLERLEKLADRELANLAGDLAINPDLRNAGWTLPDWVAYPEKFDLEEGLILEQYYDLLKEQKESGKLGKSMCDLGGPGGKGGKGKGKGKDQGQGEGEFTFGAGKCGSCAGNGISDEIEAQVDAETGRNPADIKRIQKQTAKEIKNALNGPGKGNMPAGLKDLVEYEEPKKTVDWRQQLRSVIRRATGRMMAGRSDFSLRRPSKRSFLRGILRPGMIDRKVNMAFIRDTSASMGTEQIQAANNEIIQLFKQMGIESAWLLDADARSYTPVRVRVRDIPKLEIQGRGGTSFVPALEAVQKLRPKPDIVIYLTDGDGDAPARKPRGMEVIWCVVPSQWGRKPADWGRLVIIADDQVLNEPYNWHGDKDCLVRDLPGDGHVQYLSY